MGSPGRKAESFPAQRVANIHIASTAWNNPLPPAGSKWPLGFQISKLHLAESVG